MNCLNDDRSFGVDFQMEGSAGGRKTRGSCLFKSSISIQRTL